MIKKYFENDKKVTSKTRIIKLFHSLKNELKKSHLIKNVHFHDISWSTYYVVFRNLRGNFIDFKLPKVLSKYRVYP